MPRTKAFDPDTALDRAMVAFFAKGYTGTSVQDLVAAMGVNRASLYATFGDKDALFRKVLLRYADQQHARQQEVLEAAVPLRDALRRLLDLFLDNAADPRPEDRGCLIVHSAVEAANLEPDTRAWVQAAVGASRDAVYQRLLRAVAEGELEGPVDELADAFTAGLMGLRLMARAGVAKQQLYAASTQLLRLVP